jgi:2-polyprenyl-3-methyl-5-hydroxy-6-metoxy-1,4-benzoquinol methylase
MSKEDWKKNTLPRLFAREKLWPWKKGEIVSVLDVACGLSLKSKYIPAQLRVGVDIHEPYFKHIEADVPYVVIKHDIRKLKDIFVPKSFDLVIALDIIEHIKKDEGFELMKQCEKIARKAVIFETPKGYVPQNIDIQGHGGDRWQTHRSGWDETDFTKRGYKVVVREYLMQSVRRHTKKDVDPNIELIDAIKFL